ncbi:hypothetical protein Avbf_11810 [Armadillidium vulgare]|nr:hypothetical protein Avbf_11810 [Armadillidium vulgare]
MNSEGSVWEIAVTEGRKRRSEGLDDVSGGDSTPHQATLLFVDHVNGKDYSNPEISGERRSTQTNSGFGVYLCPEIWEILSKYIIVMG